MSNITQIDETSFIEAPEGQDTLAFADEKQQARFELGVSMMVYRWDALTVAVDNNWGGPDSAEKRDWITAIVVDLFKSQRVVDIALIEETLLYAMVDEFDTNVEDDSALPIAADVLKLYHDCSQMVYDNVERLYLEWQQKQSAITDKRTIKIQGDDDSSDSDLDDEVGNNEAQYSDENLVVPDTDTNTFAGPIIDEDGFEVVQKKGRRYN